MRKSRQLRCNAANSAAAAADVPKLLDGSGNPGRAIFGAPLPTRSCRLPKTPWMAPSWARPARCL